MPNTPFDPNSYALKNGNFIGLPYQEEDAQVILLPVPWEATVSSNSGTAQGPETIREASYQLDLMDWDIPKAWATRIFMPPSSSEVSQWNQEARALAIQHIEALEQGKVPNPVWAPSINQYSEQLNQWVYQQTKDYLAKEQIVGLIGGEHSVPFGYLKALAEQYEDFGVLQIDAHADLRKAYEDLEYSHASIFYKALEELPQITQLTQVALRDMAPAEQEYAQTQVRRIKQFSMAYIRRQQFTNHSTFQEICTHIVATLPHYVYISFDIDGLDPALCPNTGTPVPGGLNFWEAQYLLVKIHESGRRIIGFDLSEVGSGSEWDGNVGARIAYKLSILAQVSRQNRPKK
ncbi:MAG: agmatinase family protein [Aureispira sp.]